MLPWSLVFRRAGCKGGVLVKIGSQQRGNHRVRESRKALSGMVDQLFLFISTWGHTWLCYPFTLPLHGMQRLLITLYGLGGEHN